MNILGILSVVVGFLLLAVLLKVVRVPRNILLMADMNDTMYDENAEDEDIKIAGSSFGSDPARNEELANKAAQEFLLQKEKGNIDQAAMLGELYADSLWKIGQDLIMNEQENNKEAVRNEIMLYGYIINKVVGEKSPLPLLAQTTLSVFYKRVAEISSVLEDYISDIGAMTLYILHDRNEEDQEIGEIFASLVGNTEAQAEMVALGNKAYADFYEKSSQLFDKTVEYKK